MKHDESAELKERMGKLPDEELLNIVEVEATLYRREALDYAKAELTRRGIKFQEGRKPAEKELSPPADPSKVMRKLTSCKNIVDAGLLKGFLTENGIECEIGGTYLSMGLGEIPFTECFPELWVADEDLESAEEILAEWRRKPVGPQNSWRCRGCGEVNEGQFTACWRCGRAKQ